MNYIFDTSSIILLICDCKLGNHLLRFSTDYGHKLYAPKRVYEEYLENIQNESLFSINNVFDILDVKMSDKLLPYFHFDSSDGEFWVISHAIQNPDCCCVIDEKFGRRLCEILRIKYIGSIGIIKILIDKGIVTKTRLTRIEKSIRSSTFYYSEDLLMELRSKMS